MNLSGLGNFVRSYADVQRKKRGLPTQQEHDMTLQAGMLALQKAGLSNDQIEAAIGQTGAATEHLGAETELTKARTAALPGQAAEHSQLVQAQIRNYDELNHPPKVEDPIDVALRREKVRAQTKRLGIVPGAGKAPGRPYAASIGGKDVMVDPSTRQPIEGMLPPGTAQMKNREEQAGIIVTAGQQLKNDIDKASSVIGPRAGRAQQAQEGLLGVVTGGPNPLYSGVKSQLGSFEALLPILHGFRGGPQVIAQFQKSLGGGLNQPPENLKTALDSVIRLAVDIQNGRAVPIAGDTGHSPAELTNNDAPDTQLSPEEDAILKELMQ